MTASLTPTSSAQKNRSMQGLTTRQLGQRRRYERKRNVAQTRHQPNLLPRPLPAIPMDFVDNNIVSDAGPSRERWETRHRQNEREITILPRRARQQDSDVIHAEERHAPYRSVFYKHVELYTSN